jgi:hypothetical protein
MTLFCELNGERVIEGRVVIPTFGAWNAALTIDREVDLPAKGLTLSLAGLSLVCSKWSAHSRYQGRTSLRVIGGYAGWRNILKDRGYNLPGGVKVSLVLGQIAQDVGERISVTKDRTLGDHYTREAGTSGTVHLNYLLNRRWRFLADGTTTDAEWPTGVVSPDYTVTNYDGATRVATIASERPGDLMPNKTLQSVVIGSDSWLIAGVVHTISKGALRTEVLIT